MRAALIDRLRGNRPPLEAVAIGVSAGGIRALKAIFAELHRGFRPALLVVQHMAPSSDDFLARMLDGISAVPVKQADDKEPIVPGHAYLAPPNYHLLVEEERILSLSVDGKVNYARPSIDLLFETAAYAYGAALAGVVLTGANHDGSGGLAAIKAAGGIAVAQDPDSAEVPVMPREAIRRTPVDRILPLDEIAPFLNTLSMDAKSRENKWNPVKG